VVEHIPSQKSHIDEIVRVVKPGGAIYLATPNKLWVRDPHYKLPFISWLPRWASNKYLRIFTPQGEWDIYPLSHRTLKRWVHHDNHATINNALPSLVKNPNAKDLDTWDIKTKTLSRMPHWFLETSKYWSPTLIYVVESPKKKRK
jgi:ubiquinone/menaquinone biosynthesis C-methylase UbiE